MMIDYPKRKLHRLKEYDYTQNGYYFITICTKNREKLLSKVGNAVLQSLVAGFKSVTTREYNKLLNNGKTDSLWQSSFYDMVIRNEEQLFEIRNYIFENPIKWEMDKYYEK